MTIVQKKKMSGFDVIESTFFFVIDNRETI